MEKPIIIQANSTEVEVMPENGEIFTPKELQGIVGRNYLVTETIDGRAMVLNKADDILATLPNDKAKALYRHDDKWAIVGDVLVCKACFLP